MSTFAKLPIAVASRTDLTDVSKLAYAALLSFGGTSGQIFVSVKRVARRIGQSASNTQTAIYALYKAGLLTRTLRREHCAASSYTIPAVVGTQWLPVRFEYDTESYNGSGLSPGAQLVRAYIELRSDDDGNAWPTMAEIGEALGVSVRTARRRVAELMTAGRLVSSATAGAPNTYRLIEGAPTANAPSVAPVVPIRPVDDVAMLEATWCNLAGIRAWNASEKDKARVLLQSMSPADAQRVVSFAFEHTALVVARFWPKSTTGAYLTIGGIERVARDLLRIVNVYDAHRPALDAFRAWTTANPDDFYPPSDIQGPHDAAVAALRAVRIDAYDFLKSEEPALPEMPAWIAPPPTRTRPATIEA